MALTVPVKKNEGNYCVLTSDGEVRRYKSVATAYRVLFDLNGKKKTVLYKNVGLGPDTNTLYLGEEKNLYGRYIEYGNVTTERILECMRTLLNNGWLDMSGVRTIHDLSELSGHEEEEYLCLHESTIWPEEEMISASIVNWVEDDVDEEEDLWSEEPWNEDDIPLLD